MKVGVIGAGQLALMLAQAAKPLGIEIYALSNTADCSAQYVANIVLGNQMDPNDITRFTAQIDVLTFEFENFDFNQLAKLALPIYPPLQALKIAQDRELEKSFFVDNNIPTTEFKIVKTKAECIAAIYAIGLPVVIKTCRDGYDGKGQAVIREIVDLEQAWQQFTGQRLIVENLIKFERELSLIVVRDKYGNVKHYPLTENFHHHGILNVSKAPYDDAYLEHLAAHYAAKILIALNYVGTLTIEFFQCGNQLITNEIAPRVHNSGHWTIEGTHTSQFENHVRAVCGLPLGNTAVKGYSAMINFIGQVPEIEKILAVENTYFHYYHKTPRPQRKLAHVTICAATEELRDKSVSRIQKLIMDM